MSSAKTFRIYFPVKQIILSIQKDQILYRTPLLSACGYGFVEGNPNGHGTHCTSQRFGFKLGLGQLEEIGDSGFLFPNIVVGRIVGSLGWLGWRYS